MDRKLPHPSALMSAYNTVKSRGKKNGLWDTARTDRAFGLLQSGEAKISWVEYSTTVDSCECPDSQYRKVICKHSLAMMIGQVHDRLMAEFLGTATDH